ncbi:hypothetical protein NRI82_004147 [Vibrio vulnificus]|nr:hypothetical protein [Vibrio vulnificus]
MIDLIKIEERIRYKLLRNVLETKKPFYTPSKYLESPVKHLVTLYGKEYQKEIRCIVTLSSRCQRYKAEGFRLPLTDSWYNENNKITKQGISRHRMSKIVHLLDQDGWITFCKGFPKWDNQKEQGQVSAILLKNIDNIINRKISEKQAPNLDELMDNIEFIDTVNTVVKKTKVNGKTVKEKSYAYLTPDNSKTFWGLKDKRANLLALNKLLQSFLIHDGDEVLRCVIYKRRFEDDLNGAGRYWCNAIQGLSQSGGNSNRAGSREEITISGEPCSEADFKTIQPRMLYLEEGVQLRSDFDVYGAELEIKGMTKTDVRTFIKLCMMSILFSSSRSGAKTSITEKLKEHNIHHLVTSEQVVSAIESHNHKIKHRFYNKDYCKVLQNYEARIAEYVIDHMVRMGKPVLPIHDSFVVRKQDCELLEFLMYEAWSAITGTYKNCVVQLEYGYEESAGIEHALETLPIEFYDDTYFINTTSNHQTDTALLSVGGELLPIEKEETEDTNWMAFIHDLEGIPF